MRIISGIHKGKKIFPDSSFSARPTTDFAKENIFNVLGNLVDFEGLHVLDLFSGTGSIGYEFASRGADEVISVELNYKHYAFIKRCAEQLGFRCMKVYKNDAFAACKKLQGRKFDVVFADPPYNLDRINDVPDAIFDNDLLAEDGVAIVEHPASIKFEEHPHFVERRVYGSVNFSIFR
ncbi:MAG: 16S rRNA (guanine(966)-N(2))-methyltransferase RsmD [Marinifilaceae bacterium]|nr:16S rRNA (guanine(966)-N(2))-methyltransferase RsmD [Marinifilaceae bacterium]